VTLASFKAANPIPLIEARDLEGDLADGCYPLRMTLSLCLLQTALINGDLLVLHDEQRLKAQALTTCEHKGKGSRLVR
jgi:hypothetical protein